MLRADLHVHSCHSLQSGNLKFLKSRDCYSRPEDVYRVAKSRGMDLVTITDHDSIQGGVAFLDGHPEAEDFFLSEEVSCRFPGTDLEVHLGAYGVTERVHADVQRLRGNVFDVAAALTEAGVFFSLNHLLHFYRNQVPVREYLTLLEHVPALETRNGTMLPAHNALVARVAEGWRRGARPLASVAGSDAHTLRRIGSTWTAAPGPTAGDFLGNLALGHGIVGGAHGSALCVAVDAYAVIGSYVASLLGRGPADHTLRERLAFLAFSVASAPAQFLPMAITAAGKIAERRQVREVSVALAAQLETIAPPVQGIEAQA